MTPRTMNVMGAYVAAKMDRIETMELRSGFAVGKSGTEGFQAAYAIRTVLDEFTIPAILLREERFRKFPRS